MRKTLIALGLLALTGCTVEVPQTTTPDPIPQEDTMPAASNDDIYLGVIKGEYPAINAMGDDAWLVDLAQTMCQALDEGMTPEELAMMVIEAEVDPTIIGTILGAAVGVYCPQHSDFYG